MSHPNQSKFLFGLSAGVLLLVGAASFFFWSRADSLEYKTGTIVGTTTETEAVSGTKVSHVPTPKAVKAIYMSQCVVGTPSFREQLVKLVDETELNSLVIDVKDYSGGIGFETDNPKLAPYLSEHCGARDMKEFLEYLGSKGIYRIARVTVFQDPLYTSKHPEHAIKRESDGGVWKDHKGLSFVDVGARPFWDYMVELARESYALGFDEINFDYIRFPSDGNMKDIVYPLEKLGVATKHDALEKFFSHLDRELRQGEVRIPISADLFGMVTTNTDDLGIGQVLEDALKHFDYVAPMVYPSHYPPGFNGWQKPATVPYELIHFTMAAAVRRAEDLASTTKAYYSSSGIPQPAFQPYIGKNQLRPWLQDFDLGATYTPEMVRAQMQATYDVGLSSWMLWDPSNKYTPRALAPN